MVKTVFKTFLKLLQLEYKYGVIRRTNYSSGPNYPKAILSRENGNNCIAESLGNNKLLVARIGATELSILLNHLHWKKRGKVVWNDYLKDEIWRQSGVFPPDDEVLDRFTEVYIDAIKQVDIMGVWNNDGEDLIIRKYCPQAALIPLEALEPYFFDEPWTWHLANKTVLVIHPFADSIKYQFENNRQNLFSNTKILPDFNLITLKAFQTQVYNKSTFRNWFEVLEDMKKSIAELEFDIAIIGAGAYGLPVGAFIKRLNKKAIHMGGATQILFGVKGKRWEERDVFKPFFNSFWKNPFPWEKPEKAETLEGGAYW